MNLKIKKGMKGSRCGRGRRETTATLKRESKKARRALGKKALNEWEGTEPSLGEPTGPVTFRLVITTQVHENYGAHCWDGKGECPQYWKAKGGNEYQRNIGDANTVIEMGHKAISDLAGEMASRIARQDEYWEEYAIGWAIIPSNEETYEEKDLREMLEWGMLTEKQYKRRIADLQRDLPLEA